MLFGLLTAECSDVVELQLLPFLSARSLCDESGNLVSLGCLLWLVLTPPSGMQVRPFFCSNCEISVYLRCPFTKPPGYAAPALCFRDLRQARKAGETFCTE